MQNVSGKQTGTMDTRGLSILVIDEDEIRASIIRQGLFEAGYDNVSLISVMHGLVQAVEKLAPDVIVIDLANPSRDAVEHLSRVSGAVRRPVAMTSVSRADSALWSGRLERLAEGVASLPKGAPILIGVGSVFSNLRLAAGNAVAAGQPAPETRTMTFPDARATSSREGVGTFREPIAEAPRFRA